jgi:hypothetical protein
MTLSDLLSSETAEFLEISCSPGVWGCEPSWEEGEWGDVCGCGEESRLTGDWDSDWESSVDLTRVVGSIFRSKKSETQEEKNQANLRIFTFVS